MPRAWTEAIERARQELTELAAAARIAPPAVAAPEPIDPAPLIEAALAPIRQRASEAFVAAAEAGRIATTAAAQADAAASAPRQSASEQVLNVFRALARILAVRVLLFLALGGTFALAIMAMGQQSWLGLVLVVSFAALTIGPLAWLEMSARPGRQDAP